jgi:dynein heavy chain
VVRNTADPPPNTKHTHNNPPLAGAGGEAASPSEIEEEALTGEELLLDQIAADVGRRLGAPFDLEAAIRKYPVSYAQSMNTMLTQELARFNRLTELVRERVGTLKRGKQPPLLL